ncbi:hypothetical protein DL771_006708 [Monosporascus sp. 5C6A]|nr:hypothetical protein DL771_006708 [Monosporascus sp. 5C6A]
MVVGSTAVPRLYGLLQQLLLIRTGLERRRYLLPRHDLAVLNKSEVGEERWRSAGYGSGGRSRNILDGRLAAVLFTSPSPPPPRPRSNARRSSCLAITATARLMPRGHVTCLAVTTTTRHLLGAMFVLVCAARSAP